MPGTPTAVDEGRVSVRLLGEFGALGPDGSGADGWQRPSSKKLLSLLLLTPSRRLERAAAGRLLFPALTPDRAANQLAKSACWCREALGFHAGVALVVRGDWLCWEAGTETDVDDLLAASRTGELPDDLQRLRALADDDRELLPQWDDDWLAGFRQEVRHGRALISRELARTLLVASAPSSLDEAIRRERQLVGDDPLDESRQADLIDSLRRAGRGVEARDAYLACRQIMWRELGAEPSVELDRRWRCAAGQWSGAPVRAVLPVTAPPGRTAVVTGLVDDLSRAELGRGSSVLVIGDAGIGKSAVLNAVADHFRGRGWRVVSAAGSVAGPGGYATIADALRRLADGTPQETFVASLLATGPSRLPPVRAENAERALHRRIGELLAAVTDLPTLLVIDDLHAADPATARLMRELAATPELRCWSVLAAARPNPPVLWDSAVVPLGRLPDDVIGTILRQHSPGSPDGAVQRMVARAAGNPLFARGLAGLLLAGADDREVPASVLQLVRARMAELPAGQRVLIPLVALAGGRANWSVLRRAAAKLHLDLGHAGIPRGQLGNELIVERDGHLDAYHPLVAEAALALLRRTDLGLLHDVLAGVSAADGDQRAAVRHRIAAFEASPTPERAELALPAACREAEHALAQGADEEAAGLARCALRAWSAQEPGARDRHRPVALDAFLALGHALATNQPEQAAAAYDNGFRSAASDDERARFVIAKGWLVYVHGDHSLAARTYQEGLDLPQLSASVRAALTVHRGWVFARQGMLDRALELCREAQELVDPDTPLDIATLILDRMGMTLVWLGRFEEAGAALDRAFELVTRVDDPSLLGGIQTHRGDLASRRGDFAGALRIMDDAMAIATGAYDCYLESVTWWIRTDTLARMGDRNGALAASLEEERVLRLLNNQAHLAACLRRRQALIG